MNTKQTLLENIHVTEPIADMVTKVDFQRINEFVTDLFTAFVSNRGIDTVRYDLNYDVQTPTDAFLVDVMEIGSVQLLAENGLLHHESFIDALYVIISAINIVVARLLREHTISNVSSYRYFDADPQYILLERAVEHRELACRNASYLFDLVSFQLLGKANGSVVY